MLTQNPIITRGSYRNVPYAIGFSERADKFYYEVRDLRSMPIYVLLRDAVAGAQDEIETDLHFGSASLYQNPAGGLYVLVVFQDDTVKDVTCSGYDACVDLLKKIVRAQDVRSFALETSPGGRFLASYKRIDGKMQRYQGSTEAVNEAVNRLARPAQRRTSRRPTSRSAPQQASTYVATKKLYYLRIETPGQGAIIRNAGRTIEEALRSFADEIWRGAYDFSSARSYSLVEEDSFTGAQRVLKRAVG